MFVLNKNTTEIEVKIINTSSDRFAKAGEEKPKYVALKKICSANASLFQNKMFYYYVALKVYHILQINICSWQCYLRQQPNLSAGLNPTERSTNDQKVLNKQQNIMSNYFISIIIHYILESDCRTTDMDKL